MTLAFLDIETSWDKTITVIGIYRSGEDTVQLVAPDITRERLMEALSGVEIIFTFNGARFDLPVIEQALGIDLERRHAHRDLMLDCWKHKLKGGLKAVERRLGIHRDTEGVDGLQAMNLWAAHKQKCVPTMPSPFSGEGPGEGTLFRPSATFPREGGRNCCEPLELLLRYNREDCENLEILARRLNVIPALDGLPQNS